MRHIEASHFERLLPDLSEQARITFAKRPDARKLPAEEVFSLAGISDWDRVLLLIWPDLIGAETLRDLVDSMAGLEPCCKNCVGKDTPEKRRTFKGAYHALHCRLRSMDEKNRNHTVAAILTRLRDILEARQTD